MKKRLMRLTLPLMALILAVGCGKPAQTAEPVTLKVSVPDGIPALTMTKMIHENSLTYENITLEYTVEKTTDALAAKVLSGEADIAVVPSNLAAQTYNKELGYKIAATGGLGSFYLISEEITDASQLPGQEITTIGKNLTPDIMLRHILDLKGITADEDVTINYLNGATELAPNYIGGKADIASVPEPMLAAIMAQKPDSNMILDFNEEWKAAHSSKYGYPQSSLIVKEELATDKKEFVEAFLAEYEKSINWANENPEELGKYAKELELGVNPETLAQAIKGANMKFVSASDSMEDYNKFFGVLFEMEAKTIGGAIPDEGLYFK